MHPFFAELDRYEVALLLTAVGLGGGGDAAIASLGHLAEPLGPRLVAQARALAEMPAETRTSLVTAELRATLEQEEQSRLDLIDATWLVHALRGEPPRIVAVILLGLQSSAMHSLLKRLPHSVRSQLPPKSELAGIDSKLSQDIRLMFATRFAPMPQPKSSLDRDFSDLIFLERDELYRLIRDLGLAELGQAFAVVEKMALLELCRRLGKTQAHELLQAVESASKIDGPDPKMAQHFLSKIVVNFDNTEEFLQKSGLWRLARASYRNGPASLAAFGQRLPRQAGAIFADLVGRAEELLENEDDGVRLRLRDAILLRVAELSRLGHISPTWREAKLQFHDQAACEAVLNAPRATKEGGHAAT